LIFVYIDMVNVVSEKSCREYIFFLMIFVTNFHLRNLVKKSDISILEQAKKSYNVNHTAVKIFKKSIRKMLIEQ